MKEITFINQNRGRWKKLEQELESGASESPDALGALYIQLTDDLAYAKTYYPQSDITNYLNRLTLQIHQQIYRNRKESPQRFNLFWSRELPMVIFENRKQLLYSFLIFSLAVAIGWVSQMNDATFVRLILTDSYVNMTLDNIGNNDPMAVYKQANESVMFLGITINNIKVAFMAFMMGIFTAMGTGFILFQNGIMLGTFQSFFYQKGLFWESAKVIWIHGTLEISAIIIAGSAGMVLGNAFLFPGTYSRMHQFKKGVKNGIKIALGLVPVFITAGFLEGFVTRHTGMPAPLVLLIIGASLLFIIWYFIIYPIKTNKLTLQHYAKPTH
ncbi:MAG TPA: hypothetical protein DCQ26_03400 [Marinilabiliales bacterium]|jgi:uncharacterized membrane protein SpoIIM required for sporulation|nr:MAG: hypothetical protein A2W95_12505 [Bacteroidetes bacterium GWA2_40_14]OFX58944.1 MAG: hypothetical protein A2W84_11525 [Bacteroidetes bacterium GWC2_40_13]OFX71315.1 MAG: hypothetical protein A2W96_14210 [Bacteroidetes bacterium GWD2_40_43]OFX91490.1 MAG: hypothetical protein A2W97_04645 [Bacteroidetes bacterium GWE2_40_63]OFY19559.1 MAG: hypothetical protein A2W88_02525 [Bacteroidetes bacterium GWF2_40_13]OFZ32175.1 MAG: hypothetical protein A2437_19355 [Bacteroidetes bacterium RIFOXYC